MCITKLENAILQVKARFVGQRRQPRPTSASTCKTFSSRVIHKKFSADTLFKAKYVCIIIFVKKLPDSEFIFLPLAT
jgi:hypothetical protein